MKVKHVDDCWEFDRKIRLFDSLRKIARSLHKLDEHNCNYGLTSNQERRERKLEDRAQEIANLLGYKLYRQGDPRGCPLYLMDNNCREYTDGIAVY